MPQRIFALHPAWAAAPPRLLVVDPSRLQRRIVAAQLARLGCEVELAEDAETALRLFAAGGIDLVVSEWRLDGDADGLDLCRALRAASGRYVYFILLTAISGSGRIAEGIAAGADDYLAKPATAEELGARVGAGLRLLAAQEALRAESAARDLALSEARRLAACIERDLDDARALQASLMPRPHARVGGVEISTRLCMSGKVGGDLLGWSTDRAGGVSLHAVDVSGHGIASALMAARLRGALSSESAGHQAGLRSPQPHCVVARLNDMAWREAGTDHYFTMLHARFEPARGRLCFVQAGHPRPLVLRADGGAAFVGEGGLPVGLVEDARWQRQEVRLGPGDRVLICSDGVTECEGPDGVLDEAGLLALVEGIRGRPGPAMLAGIEAGLRAHARRAEFEDDVSMILLDVPAALPAQTRPAA